MAQATYQIRVSGALPAELLTELGSLDVKVEPAETVLYGALPDQSALFGLITRLHGMGLRLIEVRRMAIGAKAEHPDSPGGA
jgi:hypothetical protein